MELWIPYGPVETLLTIQVENLSEFVDPKSEDKTSDIAQRVREKVKDCQKLVVCDLRRPTLKVLRAAFPEAEAPPELKVLSQSPRDVEAAVPQLKGRVLKPSQNLEKHSEQDGIALSLPAEVREPSNKLVLGTALPDPFFGLVDARVAGCLMLMANSRRFAFAKSETTEPKVMQRTPAYDAMASLSSGIPGTSYFSVVPRGGDPYSLIEEGGVDRTRGEFLSVTLGVGKGAVISPGGRGYDDTLSHAIRSVWSVIESVRRSGEVLLIAECRDGIGSEGLQMYLTGRISDEKLDRVEYAEGLEEVEYLRRLKDNYSVTLVSTIPQVYMENKLRFRVTNAASEGVKRMLTAVGKSAKMHVFSRACELLLSGN